MSLRRDTVDHVVFLPFSPTGTTDLDVNVSDEVSFLCGGLLAKVVRLPGAQVRIRFGRYVTGYGSFCGVTPRFVWVHRIVEGFSRGIRCSQVASAWRETLQVRKR